MEPLPLPHFLLLICVVVLAAGVTLWFATLAGVPAGVLAVLLLLGVGVLRLFTRVE